MSAIRLPLLCAFAGGCLSNAVLFGLWRIAGPSDSAATEQHRSHNVVELVTAASPVPSVAQPTELVAVNAADHGHDPTTEAAPTTAASDLDNSEPTPAGSAVSDVLTQLETAYRERVAARAPVAPPQGVAPQERAPAAAPSDSAVAAPSSPPQPLAEVAPVTPAVAAAEPPAPAPPALAPQAAPAALAPQLAAAPAFAGPDAPPPTEIHYGDVNQNTYITNVRQGDVYQIQVQMQQLAMLQYMQVLGASGGMAAPARRVGGAGHQRGALSSGITNPDNPWGFHFAPLNLVR